MPVTTAPDTTLSDARATMTRYAIRHLPVVENEKLVAMVSERDLSVAEAIFAKANPAASHVVRLLGNGMAHRVAFDATLDSVLEEMFSERLDAVVVVNGERLAGIFTALDACRVLSGRLVPGTPDRDDQAPTRSASR